MTDRDLALDLPLHGVQLIEASAGTGKTFAVATLHARLVLEARLPVTAILAVTYTVAATAELRDRLRQRLQLALRIAQGEPVDGAESDALAPLVAAAQAAEGANALLRRLRAAVEQMDAAPIHTIHAFCQRALAEHAVDAGLAPLRRDLVANERALREEVATAFWREASRDATGARLLDAWSGPCELAETLADVLPVDAISPPLPEIGADEDAAMRAGCEALAAAFREHGAPARALLDAASSLHKSRFNPKALDAIWQSLDRWVRGDLDVAGLPGNLGWLAPAEIDAKRTGKNPPPAPQSPLFDAIETLQAARAACERRERALQLALLHRLREFGVQRLAALKRERQQQGFDDLVTQLAAALEGDTGKAFAARLREQYRAALVDEFQDTDARQEAIFRRLFGDRALFLVGDPKQAIYRFRGGDVQAYLRARRHADGIHALHRNFRSRPLALAALQALYEGAGDAAFAWEGIAWQAVAPGGRVRDDDFTRDGSVAPAVTVQGLPGVDAKTPIGRVRELAARACAAEIAALLQAGARVRVDRGASVHGEDVSQVPGEQGATRPVQPGDIAILVERNDDALPMRRALAALGLPSVAPGRESLYRSQEAEELRRLLRALQQPGDDARLRGALATMLFGFDAAALAALAGDEAAQRQWQDRFEGWRARAERHGPLGVVAAWCAANAPRLLALADGERRLGNFLQLGEALQAGGRAGDLASALAELDRRIDQADAANEEELPRLESDADRVKVLTLHTSKGLEWNLVFLPFIATHGGAGRTRAPRRARLHEDGRQVLHFFGHDAALDAQAGPREAAEEHAEALRLLYVALTRARLATWIAWAPAKGVEDTALAGLLRDPFVGPAAWQANAPPGAVVLRDALPHAVAYRPRETAGVPAARVARRALARDWWVYSYSMLANEPRNDVAHIEERGADDEVDAPQGVPSPRSRFGGPRFGNSLHHALEHADAAAWLGWSADAPPPGQRDLLESALRSQGFAAGEDFEEGVALLAQLVRDTLNARLPEGVCLAGLPRAARRDELEFHLQLAPTGLDALLGVLHAHGVVRARAGFGLRRRIEGLLTGRIDLVYVVDDRVFVLDYKSNRLPDYTPAGLEEAIRHGEYDLQYVLYTLAVHRWLRFRRGAAYDYERDFGGVRYVFCRGAAAGSGAGIHAVKPPLALIEGLDRLFAGAVA